MKTREELEGLIGNPPGGSHPDEWNPRAETWHKERANWESEVAQLRREVERLKAFHIEDMRVTNKSAHFHMTEGNKLRSRIDALEKQLATARSVIKNDCENDELAKSEAIKVLNPLEVYGDSNGVPMLFEIVKNIADQLQAHKSALQSAREELSAIIRITDRNHPEWDKAKDVLSQINSVFGESK